MEKKRNYTLRNKRQPNPLLWISGPDENEHKYYRAFSQQRNQAKWRGEKWEMTWEEWRNDVWGNDIQYRARSAGGYYLSRIDDSKPWQKDNIEIQRPIKKRKKQ